MGLQVTPALSHRAPLAFTSSQLRPHTSRGRHSYPFLELLFSCSVASDLCSPVDCNPPGSPVQAISQARILGGLPFPFPGFFFFLMLGSNPRVLHWQVGSLQLSHQGSPTAIPTVSKCVPRPTTTVHPSLSAALNSFVQSHVLAGNIQSAWL